MFMKKIYAYPAIIASLIIILVLGYRCWFNPVTTIILVRHAEKAPGENPPLTEDGHRRAGALAHALSSAGVQAIFVSEFLRTQQTADSLAILLGLNPQIIPAADITQLTGRILTDFAGKSVLVAGHSNTVPDIIEALGIPSPPPIPENEFDNMFMVHRPRFGPARLTHLKYALHLCDCE